MMLKALVDEDKEPEETADLAQGKLKQKRTEIAEAVRGLCRSAIQKELIRSSIGHMAFSVVGDSGMGRADRADGSKAAGSKSLIKIPGIGRR